MKVFGAVLDARIIVALVIAGQTSVVPILFSSMPQRYVDGGSDKLSVLFEQAIPIAAASPECIGSG